MRNLANDNAWLWSRGQFLDRKYLMQEMYQNYVEGEPWTLPPVKGQHTWSDLSHASKQHCRMR